MERRECSECHGTIGVAASATLKWYGGPWAHLYDVYLATDSAFTMPTVPDLAETAAKTETSTFSVAVTTLAPGTTYYWKVVGKTMALR